MSDNILFIFDPKSAAERPMLHIRKELSNGNWVVICGGIREKMATVKPEDVDERDWKFCPKCSTKKRLEEVLTDLGRQQGEIV